MKPSLPVSGLLGLALLSATSSPALAQAPPGEGPALGTNRITQLDITSGALTLRQIRRRGLEIFSTPFNAYDGYGDGPFDPLDPDHTSPGNRPYMQDNGTFLRINGLDSQACAECHAFLSSTTIPPRFAIGGAGGLSATAMPFAREIDPDDQQGNGYAYYDGRLVNPPFVFGAGGVELLAKEMTIDLQLLKLKALSKPGYEIPLVTKGVSFGTISWEQRTGYDTSHVVGVDPDLVVRPFGRKGDNATVRQFDLNALPFHMGMQPVETVGQGVDDDGDGVRDEVLVGEVSAMDLFQVCSDAPHQAPLATKSERNGRYLFDELGCARCHVPSMTTRTRFLPLAFPEVPTDPTFGIYYAIDLSRVPGFAHAGAGVQVPLYSDLKRHDLGPLMGEATGSPLDRMFITPRLWGVADTAPYMHDGRALSLTQAILMHGGEAQGSTQLFAGLKSWQQEDLLAFLRTLHTPANPNADL